VFRSDQMIQKLRVGPRQRTTEATKI